MEKLMKPAEYAQELGISRQAVYAKIKKGILRSKNVEGKLYIIIDNETPMTSLNTTSTSHSSNATSKNESTDLKEYKALLRAKDETIAVLKGTVVDLKESNKQISTTLRGEIDLLKDAFFEMRTMYAKQLEHKNIDSTYDKLEEEGESEEVIEIFTQEESPRWIGLKKFFKREGIIKEKQQEKVLKRLKKAYKKGDKRLIKLEGKLKMDENKSFENIIK